MHKCIIDVSERIEQMKFNTAVSALMTYVNYMAGLPEVPEEMYAVLLKLVSPFAPHIAEEMWARLGHDTLIVKESWPKGNAELAKDNTCLLYTSVPDTWIYIQERDVKLGRLQIFNNWSPYKMCIRDRNKLRLKFPQTRLRQKKPNSAFQKKSAKKLHRQLPRTVLRNFLLKPQPHSGKADGIRANSPTRL